MNKLITDQNLWEKWKEEMPLFIIKKNNKPINRRLEHIQLIHQILFNQKKVCQEIVEKVLKS